MKRKPPALVQRALPVLLLWFFFAELMTGVNALSLTYDEPIYIGVGYAAWRTRDMAWSGHIGHPPLINLLTAWPLLIARDQWIAPGTPDPRTFPQWGTSDVLTFAQDLLPRLGGLDRVAFVTRAPVIWISVLLAALAYRWSCEIWRRRAAGWLTLLLLALDPTILAHGRLNSTDMGLAAAGFLTAYVLSRYLKKPTLLWTLAVGLAAGLPLSAKASGPYFVGIAGLWLFFWAIYAWRKNKGWFLKMTFSGVAWLFLAVLVLWGAYLFEWDSIVPGGVQVPAASHWRGLSYISDYMQSGQSTYFWGQLYRENHPWQYFLIGFLSKTPVPILLAFLLALLDSARRGFDWPWKRPDLLIVITVPLGYAIIATITALQIGQRHLLPIYPFIFVLCGRLATLKLPPRWRFPAYSLGFLLVAWLTWSTLTVYPNELSYFNELFGGSDQGHRLLADSSADWGQALKMAKTYIETHTPNRPYLAAFSSLDPEVYGLTFSPLPPTINAPITMTAPFNPAEGTYLISAVPLHGLWLLDPDTYAWFRYREPEAIVGHALHVYRVTRPTPAPTWAAQCTDASPPYILTPEQIGAGFGAANLRALFFDCAQSWVYPAGDGGWYVLPGDAPVTSWAQQRLQTSRLSYTQSEHWSHRALSIYFNEQNTSPQPEHALRTELSGPLFFLGYSVNQQHNVLEIHTYWEVTALSGRPLSLLAHLARADGSVVTVKDGLGAPIEYWQVGDVIVQRHVFSIPDEAPPEAALFFTGGYWLDTLERWRTADGADAITLEIGAPQSP